MHHAYEYMWMDYAMVCICIAKMLGKLSPREIEISKEPKI